MSRILSKIKTALFDAYGRHINREALKHEEAGPTLTGIRQAESGHPAQGLTPFKLGQLMLAAEQGDATSYLELAEEMEEKDPHYRSVISTRKRAVSGLPITVEAASDSAEDTEAADLVSDFLNRDELQGELFNMLDAIAKGYSVTEIIWDCSENQWMPKKLVYRDPRFFEYDRRGEHLLLKTDNGPQPLTPYKYIIHRSNTKSGLAIRGGLARAATWLYLFKNYDIKSWVQFLSVFGLPLRLGKYGAGATEGDKQALLRAVRDIASDAAAIIPDSMAIEFIGGQAAGEGTNSFLVFADYIDRQISKLVLGQTGTTDTGQYVGTSDAHREVRMDIETSDALDLSVSINRALVRAIVDLNHGPRKLYPKAVLARPEREDIAAWVSHVNTLVPLGLEVEESVARDKLGIPQPAKGAKLLTAPAAPMMPGDMWAGQSQRAAHKAADVTAELTGEALSDWQPLMSPALDKLKKLAAECEDFSELNEKILKLMDEGGLDMEALAGDLAAQMFLATLNGEASK